MPQEMLALAVVERVILDACTKANVSARNRREAVKMIEDPGTHIYSFGWWLDHTRCNVDLVLSRARQWVKEGRCPVVVGKHRKSVR